MISSSLHNRQPAGGAGLRHGGVYTPILASRGGSRSKRQESKERAEMAIADLKKVLSIFGGSDVSVADQSDLYKEVLLMTLSRAADADINIQAAEIDRIRDILREHTGEEFTEADIRLAARAELYAEATLRKYLGSVRDKMAAKDRVDTVHALADVFRSDKEVSVLEIDFFNRVCKALKVTPAEVAGLTAGGVD